MAKFLRVHILTGVIKKLFKSNESHKSENALGFCTCKSVEAKQIADLNRQMESLLQLQQKKIEQLVKFIWDVSANPAVLNDQQLMNMLIDIDFSKMTMPTIDGMKDETIRILENRLYSTSGLLQLSRQIINSQTKVTGSVLDTYNKAVDQHVCEWVDADGNPLDKQD